LTFSQTPECFTVVVKGTVPKTFHQRSQEKLMSKATQVELTYAQFANDLGAHQRLTLEVSAVWHRQYVKAGAVTRTALREEFMTHFVVGMLDCTMPQAVRILTATISQRTKAQHAAYMAASQKFKYHISRDGAKSVSGAPVKQARISREHRDAAMDFLGNFDGENLAEQIAQALKLLNALK
jgi:hypothetical protein